MQESDKIQVYDNQPIRTAWDEQNEEWYFSIVDVVSVLTDQPDRRRAGKYWSVLKTRLKKEGSQLPTNCSQLKLKADDGKRYKTDVANTEQLLRIIQSIPSRKAEPFKLWLAQIGRERIEETIDPELNMLAEATTTELTKVQNPQGLEENRIVAKTGGKIAGDARRRIEQETGTPVITSQNANNLSSIVTGMIEGVIEKEDK